MTAWTFPTITCYLGSLAFYVLSCCWNDVGWGYFYWGRPAVWSQCQLIVCVPMDDDANHCPAWSVAVRTGQCLHRAGNGQWGASFDSCQWGVDGLEVGQLGVSFIWDWSWSVRSLQNSRLFMVNWELVLFEVGQFRSLQYLRLVWWSSRSLFYLNLVIRSLRSLQNLILVLMSVRSCCFLRSRSLFPLRGAN